MRASKCTDRDSSDVVSVVAASEGGRQAFAEPQIEA